LVKPVGCSRIGHATGASHNAISRKNKLENKNGRHAEAHRPFRVFCEAD
jgi:hypothetical protein